MGERLFVVVSNLRILVYLVIMVGVYVRNTRRCLSCEVKTADFEFQSGGAREVTDAKFRLGLPPFNTLIIYELT